MAASTTDALFVTANVGSIFEDPTCMLKVWCDEFLSTVAHYSPKLVALHCQEVGGKNYECSMQHVSEFVKLLMSSDELQLFNKVRIFLDEDYSSAEHFTALGNFYFIHESISDENIQIFNFQENRFESCCGKEVFSENIENVATKEKSKFPQEFFPECKWSRKGFMRTRWNLNGSIFDLVNIHLFHDASNFVAMESFPSVYSKNRQRALEHTLKRFHTDQYGNVPFFVFGDFNFRTDTQGVVKKLSEGLNEMKVSSSKTTDHSKLQYKDESSQQVVFTLGKKEFSHQDHQKLFVGDESEWLREYDRELESFSDQLFEFNINFPPTYPYVEDSEGGELYMQTRCPSWCDRVFLSSNARELVDTTGEESTPEYGLIGLSACMGDHKPVFLRAALLGGLGIFGQEEPGEFAKPDVAVDTQKTSKNLNPSTTDILPTSSGIDSSCPPEASQSSSIEKKQLFDEELNDASIIKNHLDPVPFPEPAFNPAPPFRYILWQHTENPIKVFKETQV